MISFPINALAETAKHRPPGYFATCLRWGRFQNGQIHFTKWQYWRLRWKYSGIGLGDLVHFGLRPVVSVLDKTLGTKLATCSACARRRKAMNRWFKKVKNPVDFVARLWHK